MIYAPIDAVFVLLAIILIIRAALHGFVDEIMGIAWLVFGLLFAVSFFRRGAVLIREKYLSDVKILPEVLAFIALFLIVFIIVKIVTAILKDIILRIKLGGLDHFFGAIFGLLESAVIIGIIIFIITIQPLFDKETVLKNSFFMRLLNPFMEKL
jgi:membrane protein required for colicin V production